MALTNCPLCDGSVSAEAEKCPDCDFPINTPKKVKTKKKEGYLLQTLHSGCMILVIAACMLALFFFLKFLNDM